jgi:zinc transport system permease protein
MLDLLQYEFMRKALYAGLLASLACGIIGTYVVVKRIASISGGIAHTSFGGIGLGYYLGISPVLGAVFFTLASALGMGMVTRRTRIPEDTVIGVLWALGMALGIIFIALTPGYAPDLFSYLFGNILTVPFSDLMLMVALDAVILVLVLALYREFLYISFDEESSTVMGIPTELIYLLLLCLIALTVVVLIRVVGVILVIALLTIPATTARQFTHSLRNMMALAVLVGAVCTVLGLWFSYLFDLPSGATIVAVGVALLLISLGTTRLHKRMTTNGATQAINESPDTQAH